MTKEQIKTIELFINSARNELTNWRDSQNYVDFTHIGALKCEINEHLSDLHKNIEQIPQKDFYSLKNGLKSLLELCADVRKDMKGRAYRIERAIIHISNEQYEGKLWKEILTLAREYKKDSATEQQ